MIKTYINFSGGVDSTYYLWKWLQNNPNEGIMIHHCLYEDGLKKRANAEKKAVDNIMNYLKSENLLKEYHYVETEWLKFKNATIKIFDVEIMGMISGVIIKNYPNIEKVLFSYCFEETSKLRKYMEENPGKHLRYMGESFRTCCCVKFIELMSNRKLNFEITHAYVSKQQMIDEMPVDLLKLVWFCRKPTNGEPCKECHACRISLEAYNQKIINNK
jgi:7-cyano-7-deazaguanine synthase in queuosine biosynthesis